MKDFTDEWKKQVEDAEYMGQKYVISPSLEQSLRETRSDLIAYMDIFNQCGELCQEYGMKFGYHNHDFEFYTKLDGEVMYDIILDNTDPNLVTRSEERRVGKERRRRWERDDEGEGRAEQQ